MSEQVQAESAPAANEVSSSARCESPPVAPQPAREERDDPRVRLTQIAGELMRSHNRRLVIEYLRLRRAIA
jgi:hypothetical protein